MPNDLVRFWQDFSESKRPFLHPQDDKSELWQKSDKFIDPRYSNFDDLIRCQFSGFDNRFHLSLLPIPYAGDLSRAEIVILQLNPGLQFVDYWAEDNMPIFRKRFVANLRQDFEGVKSPFLYLDPQFCWHSGFVYWEAKLRHVASVIAEKKFEKSYFDALRYLSRHLAVIELVPYHSASFGAHSLIGRLPSATAAREFVRKSLVPEAKAGRRTLIVARRAKEWHLPKGCKDIVIYSPKLAQGAGFGPHSPGAKAILKRLCG